MKKLPPFAYLAENLNRIDFVCPSAIEKAYFPHDPLLKDKYTAAVKKMLIKLDAYFVLNELYIFQDYQKIVNDMLEYPYLIFGIDDETYYTCGYLGYHVKKTRGKISNLINITSQILNIEPIAEANLMFQFILMLVLGPKQLEFVENGKLTYLTLPRYDRTIKGFVENGGKKVFKNDSKTGYGKKTSILPTRYLGYNFLSLGLIELLVRKILNSTTGTTMFLPHVKMVNFLNIVQGETIKDRDILQGKLIHYHLGREVSYQEFYNLLENFQVTYFSAPRQDYENNEFYLDATYFALMKLIDVNMQSSPKPFLETLAKIIKYYPLNQKIDLRLISNSILKYIQKHSGNNEKNQINLILMQNSLELLIDQLNENNFEREIKINSNISKIRFF